MAQPLKYDPALTDSIMRQIRNEAQGEQLRRRAARRICATIVIVPVLVASLWGLVGDSRLDTVQDDLQRLAKTQTISGEWQPEFPGAERYTLALSALAVHALTMDREQYAVEVLAGVNALLVQQSPLGEFGGLDQAGQYNHAIVTQVLVDLYATGDYPLLKAPTARALTALFKRQTEDGGWSFSTHRTPHRALTVWNLHTLTMARRANLVDMTASIGKARRYLAQNTPTHYPQEQPPAIYYDAFVQLSGGSSTLRTTQPLRLPDEFLVSLMR